MRICKMLRQFFNETVKRIDEAVMDDKKENITLGLNRQFIRKKCLAFYYLFHRNIPMRTKANGQRYLSLLFYIILVPYSSHFLISIRARDALAHRLQNRYYWIALIYTLLLSYGVAFGIAKFSLFLDKHPRLGNHIFKRMIWQLSIGLLLPTVLVIGMTAIYFWFFGENIIDRGYFAYELPIVVLYLAVINGFYLLIYSNNQIWMFKRNYLQQKTLTAKEKRILVHHKGGQLPILVTQIALIDQIHQVNWLIMQNGESHVLHLSLKEIMALLESDDFFQVNRKQIVNKKAIKKIVTRAFGKLELILAVPYENQVTVSKDRAKRFKEWLATG